MADNNLTHVSIPRIFSSGNFREWLARFHICARSNGWDDAIIQNKIAVYLELSDEDQKKFASITTALEKNFHPETEELDVLTAFNSRNMLPGETPRIFLHHLKTLLKHSGIDKAAHEKLLFFRFVTGLPPDICAHIKAATGIKTVDEALASAQRLIAAGRQKSSESAAITRNSVEINELHNENHNELQQLKEAVNALSVKVDGLLLEGQPGAAALRRDRAPAGEYKRRNSKPTIICFRCQRPGHPARLCRAPAPVTGPSQRSGNAGGRGVAAIPTFGRPHQGSRSFL